LTQNALLNKLQIPYKLFHVKLLWIYMVQASHIVYHFDDILLTNSL